MAGRLCISRIEVGRGTAGSVRVALVADLHDRPGEAVLAALRAEKPDIIAVAGDLLETHRPPNVREERSAYRQAAWKRAVVRAFMRLDDLYGTLTRARRENDRDNLNAYAFLREAARLAPVCYALGNHERYLTEADRRAVKATGALLLDNSAALLHTAAGDLRVGGLSSRSDGKWLARFAAQPGRKLLLCHHPEYYPRLIREKAIPLTLAGHAHGGQWRYRDWLGRWHGLYAPGQGLFPRYTGGAYEGGRLIVSRGLANTAHLPRLFNDPELVLVTIHF